MRAWRTAPCGTRSLRPPHSKAQTPERPFSCSRVRLSAGRAKSVADLLRKDEAVDHVAVDGWVRSVRKQKRIAFAALGDGSTVESLQAVLGPDDAANLSHGTAVRLEGQWKPSQGSKQSYELQTSKVSLQGENDAENNPLQPKYQTAEYLRTIPHLRPRIPANVLLLRLRSQVIATITRFFNEEEFVQTHTPIITSSYCEGAGEVFTVSSTSSIDAKKATPDDEAEHFFRQPKYLTVSAQLHLEALAQAVSKVWTLSPTFRAEKSDTSRHLSEFYMLEAEQCFVSDISVLIDLVERMLRAVALELKLSKLGAELLQIRRHTKTDQEETVTADELQLRWDGMATPNWRRMTYATAISDLQASGFKITHGDSLSAEHERALANLDNNRIPVFVTDYPSAQKPFYMPPSSFPSSAGADTVACFDLLVPDLCELVGGSLREFRSQELLAAMRAKNVAGNNLEWYRDLRRYGSVPHGGFGLGFDRLLCYLAGLGSIRDIVAFPRWHGRCDC